MDTHNKEIIVGAVIGSLIGSLSSLFLPKHGEIYDVMKDQAESWVEKAKEAGEDVYDKVKHWGEPPPDTLLRDFASGAFLGVVIGATSALLLTPKTGKQLRKGVTQKYYDVSEKANEFIESINNKKKSPKRVHKVVKRKVVASKRKHPK